MGPITISTLMSAFSGKRTLPFLCDMPRLRGQLTKRVSVGKACHIGIELINRAHLEIGKGGRMRTFLLIIAINFAGIGADIARAETRTGPIHEMSNPYCVAEAEAFRAEKFTLPSSPDDTEYFNRMLSAPDEETKLLMTQLTRWQNRSVYSDPEALRRNAADLVGHETQVTPQYTANYAWQACIARHLADKLDGK